MRKQQGLNWVTKEKEERGGKMARAPWDREQKQVRQQTGVKLGTPGLGDTEKQRA